MKQLKKNLTQCGELLAKIKNAVTVAQIESDPADLQRTLETVSADAQTLLNRWREVEHGTDMRKLRVKRQGLRQTVKILPLYLGKAAIWTALGYFGEIDLTSHWGAIESDLEKVGELLASIEKQVPNA